MSPHPNQPIPGIERRWTFLWGDQDAWEKALVCHHRWHVGLVDVATRRTRMRYCNCGTVQTPGSPHVRHPTTP